MDFWLASASPRRKELLDQVGYRFGVRAVALDETPLDDEGPLSYVRRLAAEKARGGSRACPVLGADTTVTIDGHILGKPADFADFVRMMRMLSGREHTVYTGVAVSDGMRTLLAHSETRVRFCALGDADIEAYWATGEPIGKAGGYAIQGGAAVLVATLTGSYSGVVGLPLFETRQLLSEFGISPWHGRASE